MVNVLQQADLRRHAQRVARRSPALRPSAMPPHGCAPLSGGATLANRAPLAIPTGSADTLMHGYAASQGSRSGTGVASDITPLQGLVLLSEQLAANAPDHALPDLEAKVAELEAALGTALLLRDGSRRDLTPAALELVAFARRTLAGDPADTPLPRLNAVRDVAERRMMSPAVETGSNELVDQTMHFVSGLARARSSMFFWVGPNCEILESHCQNIDHQLVANYVGEMCEYDPLHIARLKSGGQLIATLSAQLARDGEGGEAYRAYCSSIGVGDEIDMLFWRGGRPFACLALFRSPEDPPFSLTELDWEALRRHVQASLRMHWRVRSVEVERVLMEHYGLQQRELDVVELITQGKSNADISDILEISVATVKVHVVNILKKMGVDSRLAVACVVGRLQQA